MNANELADKSFMELWDSYTSKKMECDALEEKLRQQQAEIEELKLLLQRCLPIAYWMNAMGGKSPMYANDPTLVEESIRAILRKAQEK